MAQSVIRFWRQKPWQGEGGQFIIERIPHGEQHLPSGVCRFIGQVTIGMRRGDRVAQIPAEFEIRDAKSIEHAMELFAAEADKVRAELNRKANTPQIVSAGFAPKVPDENRN